MDEKQTPMIGPIEDMLKKLNSNAVFGEPVREGETVIIPVASVNYGFGYGGGSGRPSVPVDTSDEEAAPVEGGSGGGGGGAVKPLGFIRIRGDDVQYEPMMHPQVISLAGIAMMAWLIFWLAKTVQAFVRKPGCCG